MSDISDIIDECESYINSSTTTVKKKLESINTLVQVKSTSNLTLHYSDLYKDVKKLIIYYIDAIEERKYEYDLINKAYVKNILEIFKPKEKVALYDFFIRKLKKNGLDDQLSFFLAEKRKCEITILCEKPIRNFLKIVSKIISCNLLSIICTILFSYITYFILLLPSSTIVLFEVRNKQISNNFLVNHLSNTLMGILGLNSDEYITPTNTLGVILVVLGKLIFILIILRICIDKFIETFKSSF